MLKFKPKRGYKRRSGHRSELTRLEIKDIKMLSRKPATKKAETATAGKESPSHAEAGEEKTTGKRGGTRSRSGGGAKKGAKDGS